MTTPLVIKLGGDAVATPERIAVAARRVAARNRQGPVIAVVSARRGVTDHLLGLTREVQRAVGARGSAPVATESDRAVAAGEVVTAALLSLALRELGVSAVSLDAREAGLRCTGRSGQAMLSGVDEKRLVRWLDRGHVPVVTGFQGWRRGRVVTLGRGGSDLSAVVIAAALDRARCEFVKEIGLLTCDPKLVPEARPLPRVPHAFLTALASAGARVLHAGAAALAERHRIPLVFGSLEGLTPLSLVDQDGPSERLRAIAVREDGDGRGTLTLIGAPPPGDSAIRAVTGALDREAIPILDQGSTEAGWRIVVPAPSLAAAARSAHAEYIGTENPNEALARAS